MKYKAFGLTIIAAAMFIAAAILTGSAVPGFLAGLATYGALDLFAKLKEGK